MFQYLPIPPRLGTKLSTHEPSGNIYNSNYGSVILEICMSVTVCSLQKQAQAFNKTKETKYETVCILSVKNNSIFEKVIRV
jgi:hypothetical protein